MTPKAPAGTTNALIIALFTVSSALGAACQRQPVPEAYTPGLGEIMSLQQMRHVKLWLAGQAENWELAQYELDELGEGFDDVVKFHPTHKDSPVALKDAIPRIVTQPLKDVRAAVEKKDSRAFVETFASLTASCNSCHQATNFGFNRVQAPTSNPYPNQVFAAARP